MYIDNLFRVSDSTEVQTSTGTPLASDTEYTAQGGVRLDWLLGRQRFLADLSINYNHYDQFDFLDYTGGDAYASWRWGWGDFWNGELGYNFRRAQASFAELVPINRDINTLLELETRNQVFAYVERKLDPRWRLRFGGDWADSEFRIRTQRDRTRTSGSLGLFYYSQADNSIGLQGIFKSVDFPINEQSTTGPINNDYFEADVHVVVDWAVTSLSQVQLRAGYVRRDQTDQPELDFSGGAARLNYIWRPTSKTWLTLSGWHELTDVMFDATNYAVTDGVSIEPRWFITKKLILRLSGAYEHRDFRGADPTSGIESGNKEELFRYGVSLQYDVLRNLRIYLDYKNEERSSTQFSRNYDANAVTGTVSLEL